MTQDTHPTRRRLVQGGLAVGAALAMPAIGRAQGGATGAPIRIGHLTPRTGFLGPLGEYAVAAAQLATEEINAAGGINGRKVELLTEDSVNPQTASSKAERYIERDKVSAIVGEISSASALAIGQVATRGKTVFLNTGANSDALRGQDCKRFMFHVEGANSMYVKAVGRSLVEKGLVKGKRWYSLTADYAFGHDLLKVAKVFMQGQGGTFAADELVPTDATDFSAYLIKIRQAKPDVVISNLAGNQITNFLKQYAEYGLPFPVAGFGFDTALAWGAGAGNFAGTWPCLWHHKVDTPSSKAFVAAFTKKLGKPPENQAWGDYNAVKIVAQAMASTQSTEGPALVSYLEGGAKFDVLKPRQGYFRPRDHQLISEMFAITALPADQVKDKWDLFTSTPALPGPNEDMEVLAPTAEEAGCRMEG
ncbi:ABC transporter substrate-binding protein [uncultured Methylobacterium sp.]|mgnify:CR=1 FL=1|jgi:branched-chain amino acid transport system substrate-binding protein|uniref:ABC transporter substrate-binding protein n=1 Tax=uncultured Methylobacterium sp. TaxID=157278 RepID=UPI00260865C3|nr:ABC transporter substrate-binding protein [uncultured Methylobacterium sp.]